MVNAWIPLGVRLGVQDPVTLKDNFSVNEGSRYAAISWVKNVAYNGRENNFEQFFGACTVPAYVDSYTMRNLSDSKRLIKFSEQSSINLLNVLDYLGSQVADDYYRQELTNIAVFHNVNWQIDPATGRLVRRVLPETQEHYLELARSVAEECSAYLQDAFTNAYGHNGNPNESWVSARKAVEYLLHPLVSPNNSRATISTMIRDIKQAPSKWSCDIPVKTGNDPVMKFVELLEMMPYEPGHHGQTPGQATLGQAKTQFNLALAVCQILHDKSFRTAD